MDLLFDEQDTIISATESRRALGQTPVIVSVITEKHIRDMGVHTLIEVLESVPGFKVSYPSGLATGYTVSVRGLTSGESENTLLMINGHRVSNHYSGSWTFSFDEFPLADVRRIEIIRGPGSALYGSNAVVAVIHIITRQASDFHDAEATVAAGDRETQRGHLSIGTDHVDHNVMLSLDEASTHRGRGTVGSDSAGLSGRKNFWRRQQSGYVSVTGGD
ncbi:MAG: TonB-dependent receptor plug domain-containing protein [Mariprofundaceae bacterium]|nr:TonB-dependent receptor plug domain-containing protein [Mariprofundaceae bacterium]